MATVAQLVEPSVVVRVVAGSSPVGRPIIPGGCRYSFWAPCRATLARGAGVTRLVPRQATLGSSSPVGRPISLLFR